MAERPAAHSQSWSVARALEGASSALPLGGTLSWPSLEAEKTLFPNLTTALPSARELGRPLPSDTACSGPRAGTDPPHGWVSQHPWALLLRPDSGFALPKAQRTHRSSTAVLCPAPLQAKSLGVEPEGSLSVSVCTITAPLGKVCSMVLPQNKLLVRDLSCRRAEMAVGKWHMSGKCLVNVCLLPAPALPKGSVSQHEQNALLF